jgi:hypothetical protein
MAKATCSLRHILTPLTPLFVVEDVSIENASTIHQLCAILSVYKVLNSSVRGSILLVVFLFFFFFAAETRRMRDGSVAVW